jgi:hypothetical protein
MDDRSLTRLGRSVTDGVVLPIGVMDILSTEGGRWRVDR